MTAAFWFFVAGPIAAAADIAQGYVMKKYREFKEGRELSNVQRGRNRIAPVSRMALA